MVNNSKTGNERGLVFTEKKLKFFLVLVLADIVYESLKNQNNILRVKNSALLYILISKKPHPNTYIGTVLNQST
jgi:hypothetical protein